MTGADSILGYILGADLLDGRADLLVSFLLLSSTGFSLPESVLSFPLSLFSFLSGEIII